MNVSLILGSLIIGLMFELFALVNIYLGDNPYELYPTQVKVGIGMSIIGIAIMVIGVPLGIFGG